MAPPLNFSHIGRNQPQTRRSVWTSNANPNTLSFTQGIPTDVTNEEIAIAVKSKLPEDFQFQMHCRGTTRNPFFYAQGGYPDEFAQLVKSEGVKIRNKNYEFVRLPHSGNPRILRIIANGIYLNGTNDELKDQIEHLINHSRRHDLGGLVQTKKHQEGNEEDFIHIGKITKFSSNPVVPGVQSDVYTIDMVLEDYYDEKAKMTFNYVPPEYVFQNKSENDGTDTWWDTPGRINLKAAFYKPYKCDPCWKCGMNTHSREDCKVADPCESCGAQDHATGACNREEDSNHGETRENTPHPAPRGPSPSPSRSPPPPSSNGGSNGGAANAGAQASKWAGKVVPVSRNQNEEDSDDQMSVDEDEGEQAAGKGKGKKKKAAVAPSTSTPWSDIMDVEHPIEQPSSSINARQEVTGGNQSQTDTEGNSSDEEDQSQVEKMVLDKPIASTSNVDAEGFQKVDRKKKNQRRGRSQSPLNPSRRLRSNSYGSNASHNQQSL